MSTAALDDFDTDDGGLAFWHPTDNAELTETYLPAGNVAAGSSTDVRLRVKNTSTDYTASDVTVAVAGPADPAAADGSPMHLLSVDADTFTPSVPVGDLAAGQVSDPVTVRRTTAPDAAAQTYAYTLTATAGGWQPAVAGATTGATPIGSSYDPDAAQPLLEDPEEQM